MLPRATEELRNPATTPNASSYAVAARERKLFSLQTYPFVQYQVIERELARIELPLQLSDLLRAGSGGGCPGRSLVSTHVGACEAMETIVGAEKHRGREQDKREQLRG